MVNNGKILQLNSDLSLLLSSLLPTNLVPGRSEHDNGGPDGERRDGDDGEDHVVGARVLGVHAQDVALLVRDVAEDLVDAFGRQGDLLLLKHGSEGEVKMGSQRTEVVCENN